MNEIILGMKLRKFHIERILGHLQGGNYEFKIWWKQYRNILEKDYITKRTFQKNVTEKHSVYKKSVYVCREQKREEIRRKEKKDKRGKKRKRNSVKKRRNIVDSWSQYI